MIVRSKILMTVLMFTVIFVSHAKNVKALKIVFTDICMTTIYRITPSYFDKGALSGICDTISIVNTKKIKELMMTVNELQEFTSYKTVPDTRGKVIFLYDDNQTEDLYFSAFFALYMGKLYELSNQFKLLMNRIIISRKPNSEVFQIVHRKKRISK